MWLEWAEEFGVGEMGLTPEDFWSLTVREFWLKWHAFARAADRHRALAFELALMVNPHMGKQQKARIEHGINQLRRYPIKRWLLPDVPTR